MFDEVDGACKEMNLLATVVLDSVSTYGGDVETYSWLPLFKTSVA
jgi:hypothetical protein